MRKQIREVLAKLAGRAIEIVPSTFSEQGLDEYVNAILEILRSSGVKGEVKAISIPAMIQGEISFDDFDTTFTSENKYAEIILNGAEDMVYGKSNSHVITPKKGHLIFIEEDK